MSPIGNVEPLFDAVDGCGMQRLEIEIQHRAKLSYIHSGGFEEGCWKLLYFLIDFFFFFKEVLKRINNFEIFYYFEIFFLCQIRLKIICEMYTIFSLFYFVLV